jgi:hypothetical protein
MGHLQQVEAAAVRDACRQELRVDALLDVAGQKQATGAEAQVQHRRHVVDAGAGVGWLRRDAAARRPADVHGRIVEAQPIACGEPSPIQSKPVERLVEGRVAGSRATHPDLGHGPHTVSLEEEGKAGHVVLVRVGQHDEVDAAIPGRELRVEDDEQAVGVRSAVDEHPAPGVALDEDGIALPDVQHGQPQASVGSGRDREPGAGDEDGQGSQPDPQGSTMLAPR